MTKTKQKEKPEEKVKTTILLDRRIKKLAQIHALQNDMTLQQLVETALEKEVLGR